jgi:type IV secretion system protein VirB3
VDLGTRRDTLFLACTRPTMVAGVTMEAFAANVAVCGTLFVISERLECLALVAVMHGVCRAITYRDHNAFRVIGAWLDTWGRCRNTSFWGGSSVTPLKLVRRFDERDL